MIFRRPQCNLPPYADGGKEDLAYGPTNLKAYDFIAPKRAAVLPTAAANIKNIS